MATKSELFVIAFKNASDNSVKYAGLDARDSFIKVENPMSLKKFFSHEQAVELVKALRKKGLEEGISIKAKAIGQSIRDYTYSLILAAAEMTDSLTDAETMQKVLKRYEVKETKKAEDESAEAEPEAEPEVEAEV